MPVEIRELHIKGTIIGNNQVEKSFEKPNSPLLQTRFIEQLKKEIVRECTEIVFEKIERKNRR